MTIGKVFFRCLNCGEEYPIETTQWRCSKCEMPFELVGAPPFFKDKIASHDWSLWRYREMLPVEQPVSLGEGGTSLVEGQVSGFPVRFKLEYLSPTGSFKDRGATVLVSFLKHVGTQEVVEDSSGNAAASLAAYCAQAGIRVKIFVPGYASPAKLAQIRIFGAELVPVLGKRSDATRAAEAAAMEGTYYASHFWNPFYSEGMKTFAYELAEQLGWHAPDNIIFPCGHGSLLLGAHRGFHELLDAGVVSKIPRLFAVQAEACAPLAEAFQRGLEEPLEIEPGETIAEGIRISHPVHGREILRAVRDTSGAVLSVSDQEITQALDELARCGLFVEPTSPVPVAGLKRLIAQQVVTTEQVTAIPLTGSGLKNVRLE